VKHSIKTIYKPLKNNTMKTISETGHAINVAHFEDVISFVNGYGTTYNPSNNTIKLLALNTLNTNAKASLVTVDNALITFNDTVNSRAIVFNPLDKLFTRVYNSLESTAATPLVVADAKTIIRKLQGKRAKPIVKKAGASKTINPVPVPLPNPLPVPTPEPKNISASQLSFDNRIENFSKLITLLANEPLYVPNEADLKVAALSSLLTSLRNANSAVINAFTTLSNARISRNKTLYAPLTGVYAIQSEVKKYVKSVYGATAPEYIEIRKIKFTTPR
jgi:hypothetical protein